MSTALVTKKEEVLSVRSAIAAIEDKAAAESRDLTEAEQADVDTLFARHETLNEEIAPLVARQESMDKSAAVLARINGAAPQGARKVEATDMSAGEYFSLYARAQAGDRSAELKVRAVADQTTSDSAAVLPEPIVGSLINTLTDASRPVFDSMRSVPMPQAGKTFTRPRLTQTVAVGEQATEKTQLASRKMTFAEDQVVKRTFGGVLDISQQAIDWTEPAILDIAFSEFVAQYAAITEVEAADYLANLPDTVTPYSDTSVEAVVGSYVGAILKVYAQSKKKADTVWLPLDNWGDLVSITSDHDTPALTIVREALQDIAPNFRFVVAPELSTAVVGVGSMVESYEQKKGLVQAVNVPLFGLDVAYAGYVAFYGRPEGSVLLGASEGS